MLCSLLRRDFWGQGEDEIQDPRIHELVWAAGPQQSKQKPYFFSPLKAGLMRANSTVKHFAVQG